MSVYQKIFSTTSKRFANSSLISKSALSPERALWAFPAGLAFTWFVWGALTDEIKQSVGLYWDPDAEINRVEMEREKRLEAREALKAASKPAKAADDDEEEDEEEEEEEEVTAETISAAVAKAVEAAGGEEDDDDDDDDDAVPSTEDSGDDDDADEEEEEEEEKPKKVKVDVEKLSDTEKWDYFASKSIEPGDDDEDDDEDEDDVSFGLFHCIRSDAHAFAMPTFSLYFLFCMGSSSHLFCCVLLW
jgi:hypothetical protein